MSGTVLDTHGNPMVGSVVELVSGANGTVLATTTTNSTGGYFFDFLSSGNYTVRAEPPTGAFVDSLVAHVIANSTTLNPPITAKEISGQCFGVSNV